MAPNDTDSVMANPLWQAVHTSTASSYRRLSTKLTDARSSYESVATDEIELIGRSNNGDNYHSFAHNGHWKRKAYLIRPKPFLKAVFDDVRRAPWLWLAKRWLPHLLPIGTFLGLIVLLAIMSLPGFVQDVYDNVCKPDGSFELSFDIYTPWKRNAIFAINMGYGSYSFGVAKLIDVVWDIVSIKFECFLLYLIWCRLLEEAVRSYWPISRTELSQKRSAGPWRLPLSLARRSNH